jgi:hypothetical protein
MNSRQLQEAAISPHEVAGISPSLFLDRLQTRSSSVNQSVFRRLVGLALSPGAEGSRSPKFVLYIHSFRTWEIYKGYQKENIYLKRNHVYDAPRARSSCTSTPYFNAEANESEVKPKLSSEFTSTSSRVSSSFTTASCPSLTANNKGLRPSLP